MHKLYNIYKVMTFILFLIFVQAQSFAADPFYHGDIIPEGRIYRATHNSKPIDTDKIKAVTILSEEQAQNYGGIQADHILVANIGHSNELYIARVPKDSVKNVYLASEPFGGVLAHSMLRFEMSAPVELIAKIPTKEQFQNGIPGEMLLEPILLENLIFSGEATAPKGVQRFSALASFFNTRGLVLRIQSISNRVTPNNQKHYISGAIKTYQYPIYASPEEANKALVDAIEMSHSFGMKKMYNTLLLNCNVYCFKVIESAKPFFSQRKSVIRKVKEASLSLLNKVLPFSRMYPPLAKFGMKWRNWIDTYKSEALPTKMEQVPEFKKFFEYEVKNNPPKAKSCKEAL